jgi:hypothetical protein
MSSPATKLANCLGWHHLHSHHWQHTNGHPPNTMTSSQASCLDDVMPAQPPLMTYQWPPTCAHQYHHWYHATMPDVAFQNHTQHLMWPFAYTVCLMRPFHTQLCLMRPFYLHGRSFPYISLTILFLLFIPTSMQQRYSKYLFPLFVVTYVPTSMQQR